jgi:alanine transaminase
MSHCEIQTIAEFCAEKGIVLMADEVYQANVYGETSEFVSAKKVCLDAGLKQLQLVSFHSTSKGLVGECGRRGGYMVGTSAICFCSNAMDLAGRSRSVDLLRCFTTC